MIIIHFESITSLPSMLPIVIVFTSAEIRTQMVNKLVMPL